MYYILHSDKYIEGPFRSVIEACSDIKEWMVKPCILMQLPQTVKGR